MSQIYSDVDNELKEVDKSFDKGKEICNFYKKGKKICEIATESAR